MSTHRGGAEPALQREHPGFEASHDARKTLPAPLTGKILLYITSELAAGF